MSKSKSQVGQNGLNDKKQADKKKEAEESKGRLVNVYLFGFEGSAFTVIKQLREFFHKEKFKPEQVRYFNFPDADVTADQSSAIIFQVNQMRFSKKFGTKLRKIESVREVFIEILYIPALFFLSLPSGDGEQPSE
jgi:hypothetical protein